MATKTAKRPVSAAEQARRAEARKAQAEQMHADLERKVAELASSEQWLAYLEFAAKFHRYSFSNTLMIMAQHPTATRVAGFVQWQERGRQVRKGEKAIKIYGYAQKIVAENEETGEKLRKAIFPLWSVFAEDQTDPIEGHPAEPEHPAHRLTGDDPNGIYDAVAAAMVAHGWTVERDLIEGSSNGYTTCDGTKRIVVDARLSGAQAAKTMIHEAAHALLHSELPKAERAELHRGIVETEAESVAYVVAGILGLDTTDYSVGYVLGWGQDVAVVRATAQRVLEATKTLTAMLEADSVDYLEASA